MNVEIITIGDELLIGQVINTNAASMAQELNKAGFTVDRISVIADKREEILSALHESEQRADIILISGGLGPTRDDITKTTLCEYFSTSLVFHEPSYKNIEQLFGSRGIVISELNRKQAEIPATCKPLLNTQGTAPGMLFEKNKKIFISLPGVPFEMNMLMTIHVIPELISRFKKNTAIVHRTINTQGIGESALAELIENWENSLPAHIKLAYLPSPGIVRLRLSAFGNSENELSKEIQSYELKLKLLIPQYIFGYDNQTLEEVLGKKLIENNYTISTAESCTGGFVANKIISVPGSSRYFTGSVVAYSNQVKKNQLKVPEKLLVRYGAVSREVVKLMAENARKIFKTDVSIAVSGIAGPDGGSPEKPVGTVWIAVSTPFKTVEQHFLFGEHRERNIIRASSAALHLAIKELSL